ncbi:MAG: RNA 3'-terminal phosphate cyclase [Candidatus Woesearchaeota archaeon]|nr:RNA 3'-terminal phosphate cyclase [Candidatus Woesearchaeota archaeon]
MININGNYLEGGGQIVRTALALSAITGKSFEVYDIRKGRKDSGLKAQHLYCIKSLEQLCNAKTEGAELGSTYLKFEPGKLKAKDIEIDIGTAGSITLLLQSLLLPCFFVDRKIKLTIKGGTDVSWSMPFDYFRNVFIPHADTFCSKLNVNLMRRGHYPKGGGMVEIDIKPKYKLSDFKTFEEFYNSLKNETNKINLADRGQLTKIKGISNATKSLEKANVAERQSSAAKSILKKYNCPIDILSEYCDSYSDGSAIVLWAVFKNAVIGADCLGERGKKAEIVGEEAAKKLAEEINSGAAVDEHLADNLIPFLGLFGGKIKTSKISSHTLTNIYVVEKFLDVKFNIDEKEKIISI